MPSHPPVLTPERIDALLSGVAEICMGAVEEAGVQLKVAPDSESFERVGRTLNSACRNLRQTIAMKLRFDREQAEAEAKRRQLAETERQEARQVRDVAVAVRRQQVRSRFRDLLWDEYEPEAAEEMLDGASYRFDLLAEADPEFLDIPLETLVARISDELGMNEAYDEVEDEETGSDEDGPEREAPAPPADTPREPPATTLFNGRLAPPRDWDLDDS